MKSGSNSDAYRWCKKNRISLGLNYFPVREVVIKGEYSLRKLDAPYNNEPSINVGIAYTGWFR